MPDCSYIEIQIDPTIRHSDLLAEKLGERFNSCGGLVWDDASYGWADDDVTGAMSWLQEREIKFIGHDSAHWSWDPSLKVFLTGELITVPSDKDGNPLATQHHVSNWLVSPIGASLAQSFFRCWEILRGEVATHPEGGGVL